MTLEQYAILCITWSFIAGMVQALVPKYAKHNDAKKMFLCIAMNFFLAPICYVIAMLRWNTDLLLIIVQEKIKRVNEDELVM